MSYTKIRRGYSLKAAIKMKINPKHFHVALSLTEGGVTPKETLLL